MLHITTPAGPAGNYSALHNLPSEAVGTSGRRESLVAENALTAGITARSPRRYAICEPGAHYTHFLTVVPRPLLAIV